MIEETKSMIAISIYRLIIIISVLTYSNYNGSKFLWLLLLLLTSFTISNKEG